MHRCAAILIRRDELAEVVQPQLSAAGQDECLGAVWLEFTVRGDVNDAVAMRVQIILQPLDANSFVRDNSCDWVSGRPSIA